MEECSALVPEWLRFVCGVVDSEDLPLNVSREMLQQSGVMKAIRKGVVNKCVDLFSSLSEEQFKEFYERYSKNIKLGIHEDEKIRPKLINLLRYVSAKSEGRQISLSDYVKNMPES
jgi:molecular chaperone HtpG